MTVDQVMERWKADEAAVRARLLDPDAAPQEQVAGRSGMEVFEAIVAGELPPLPGYAPDLNPDELVWSPVKRNGVARPPFQKGEKLGPRILSSLHKLDATGSSCAHSSGIHLSYFEPVQRRSRCHLAADAPVRS